MSMRLKAHADDIPSHSEYREIVDESKSCNTCEDLLWRQPPCREEDHAWTKVIIEKIFGDIDESAKRGCQTCRAIRCLAAFLDPPPRMPIYVDVKLYSYKEPEISFTIDDQTEVYQFYTPLGYEPAWSHIQTLREVGPSSASSKAVLFLEERLRTCLQSHPCASMGTHLPTRLIDVGKVGDDAVRLIETKNVDSPSYITLSYCWGQETVFKTLGTTLRSSMEGLLVSKLPQVLQDTIFTTRELKIPYLWIDSICIIQDDKADWELESAKMCSVYRGAVLTIAAASSETVTQGFLQQRGQPKDFSMDWVKEDGSETKLNAKLCYTHHKPAWQNPRFPLNNRGWALQEQVMSTRLAMFTNKEMQWRCQFTSCCQCEGIKKSEFGPKSDCPIWRIEEDCVPEIYNTWRILISSDYATRQLTHDQDKLPAVSGIASTIQQRTGSKYLAGLWCQDIIRDLCWFRPTTNVGKPKNSIVPLRDSTYRAPTFSWASINGTVYYPDFCTGYSNKDWVPEAKFLDAGCNVEGGNPFGRVKDAWLSLRGQLAPCSLHITTTGDYRLVLNGDYTGINCCPVMDEALCRYIWPDNQGTTKIRISRRTTASLRVGSLSQQIIRPGDANNAISAYLFLLGRSADDTAEHFLVLSPCIGDPGHYERIGFFKDDRWRQGIPDETAPHRLRRNGFSRTKITII